MASATSLSQAMPVAAKITADSSVLKCSTRARTRGAVIRHKTVLRNEAGEELATLVARLCPWAMAALAAVRRPARATSRCRRWRRTIRRYQPAAGPGADLSPLWRSQSAAQRSRIRQACRLPAPDPARHVQRRPDVPRRAADLCRLRSSAFRQPRCQVLVAGLSRRDVTMDLWKDATSFRSKPR